MPDRALVFDGSQVGAVSYRNLSIDVSTTRFIESSGVPTDAAIVDRTWEFVNKTGGADRRFRDNRELPIVVYEEIHLHSAAGLNELLHVSRQGTGAAIAKAVAALVRLEQGFDDLEDLPAGDPNEALKQLFGPKKPPKPLLTDLLEDLGQSTSHEDPKQQASNEALKQLFGKGKPTDAPDSELAALLVHREYLETKGLMARIENALETHRRNPLTPLTLLSLTPHEELKIRETVEQEIARIDDRIAELRSQQRPSQ